MLITRHVDGAHVTMKSHGTRSVNLRLVLVSSVSCFLVTTTLVTWASFCAEMRMDQYGASFINRDLLLPDNGGASRLHYNGSLPFSVWSALRNTQTNGYLTGNSSHLTFHPYPHEVDLRVIVFAYNRERSLNKCLEALNAVDFEGDEVEVDIWLDRDHENNTIDRDTYLVARQFKFMHGETFLHVHASHAGVQRQWLNTWRPRVGTREIAVVLEDDMDVSPYFWRWLKRAHVAFSTRRDVSGYGLSHPGLAHQYGGAIQLHPQATIYMYRVITTWGFSPAPASWRHFQDWFYEVEQDASFAPLVPGLLPSEWWLGERKLGRERDLWEMWHIYYTHHRRQYTVLLNSLAEGLMAVNRHERGLHDGKYASGATEAVCSVWRESYVIFPREPPKIGYDGVEEEPGDMEG